MGYNPKSLENLRTGSDLTENERKERIRKMNKASHEAKRRKKTMREALEMMMFHTELNEQTKQMLEAEGIKDAEDFNHQMVITRSLIAKAEAGDVQAYNAICSMIGEKPAEKLEVSGDVFRNLRVVREVQEDDGSIPTSEDDIPE